MTAGSTHAAWSAIWSAALGIAERRRAGGGNASVARDAAGGSRPASPSGPAGDTGASGALGGAGAPSRHGGVGACAARSVDNATAAPPPAIPLDGIAGLSLQRAADGSWSLEGSVDASLRELFALYAPLLARPADAPPWVIAQLGASLDGCIATRDGDSVFVTGPESRVHLHRLRALCDAVLVGAGTVAADDPQLTTRHVPGAHAVRVVVDPELRAPPTARLFSDGAGPAWWMCDPAHAERAAARIGAESVLAVPGLRRPDGALDAGAVVDALAARGCRLLFVEGGGVTVSAFLAQRRLHRLHLAIAPVLVGAGRHGLALPGYGASMADCPRPPCRIVRMGADVLWDLDLSAMAAEADPGTGD